jgi:hypothetical protein
MSGKRQNLRVRSTLASTLELAMSHTLPSCLDDLSNEDILAIAWEPEFLDQASGLERELLQRLSEQCQELSCARDECKRLVESLWVHGLVSACSCAHSNAACRASVALSRV